MNTLSAELKCKNEEAEINRAGGEGCSSCAHGIPDGTGNDQLYGTWPDLGVKSQMTKVKGE